MSQNNTPAPPARKVPFTIFIQLLFGGFSSQFGWIFFGFGMIFVSVFGVHTDLSQIFFAVNRIETTVGIISSIDETNASEDDTPIYANTYSFQINHQEKIYKSVSYTSGQMYDIRQQVTVEYLAGNPELSRIKDARRAEFSPGPFFFIPIFPLIGLIFIISGLLKAFKANYLLARGIMGEGSLKSKQPTNTYINRQRVYKLTFEFTAEDGRHYTVASKTHETRLLEDDALERLLYDPIHPANAVMLDNLPGSPGFDASDYIIPQPLTKALVPLIVPVLAVVINSAVLILVL